MNKPSRSDTIRVVKTSKFDQTQIGRIARRYDIPPLNVRELHLGYPEEIPRVAAEQLIAAGYARRVKTQLRSSQERKDSLSKGYKDPHVNKSKIIDVDNK